jgi:hypothetical protein
MTQKPIFPVVMPDLWNMLRIPRAKGLQCRAVCAGGDRVGFGADAAGLGVACRQ